MESFSEAKQIEVKNFVASKAFQNLPPHLRPSKDQAMRMRWVLTWKLLDDGSRKPKARAVILGYLDPGYAERPTAAPISTRTTRQLFLQLAACSRVFHSRCRKLAGLLLR